MNYQSNHHKSKIIDSFLFFNEFDLLKTRLEYYGSIVDHFVISECDVDFSGNWKGFNLNNHLIKTLPFSNKIILNQVSLDLSSMLWIVKKIRYIQNKSKFLWKIQNFQRNSLLKKLLDFSEEDIIIFGDLDEFPTHKSIEIYKNIQSPMVCKQLLFYYHYRYFVSEWQGTILLRKNLLHKFKLNKLRSLRDSFPVILDGGWHFSYFFSPNEIKRKIQSIAEVEKLSIYKNINIDSIKNKIANQKDLYDRGLKIKILDLNSKVIDLHLLKILQKNMPYLEKNILKT